MRCSGHRFTLFSSVYRTKRHRPPCSFDPKPASLMCACGPRYVSMRSLWRRNSPKLSRKYSTVGTLYYILRERAVDRAPSPAPHFAGRRIGLERRHSRRQRQKRQRRRPTTVDRHTDRRKRRTNVSPPPDAEIQRVSRPSQRRGDRTVAAIRYVNVSCRRRVTCGVQLAFACRAIVVRHFRLLCRPPSVRQSVRLFVGAAACALRTHAFPRVSVRRPSTEVPQGRPPHRVRLGPDCAPAQVGPSPRLSAIDSGLSAPRKPRPPAARPRRSRLARLPSPIRYVFLPCQLAGVRASERYVASTETTLIFLPRRMRTVLHLC